MQKSHLSAEQQRKLQNIPSIYRYVECFIPVETCNLRCHYCYIYQLNKFGTKLPKFKYTPAQMRQAFSVERLGGTCLFNLCAGGETLIAENVVDIVYEILAEGHFAMIVTNALLTKRLEAISKFPAEYLERLSFKFSFHYKELLRTQKLDLFFENVSMIKAVGCSYFVELTPNDEIIAEIDKIQEICRERLDTLCHVTVARDDTKPATPLLTKYSLEEYRNIWSIFGSPLFDFKLDIFGVHRKEFCYAGDWSFWVNMGTGEMRQCYNGNVLGNIFENPQMPIPFTAIGHHCPEPYCYNGHAFLTLGVIPELDTPAYAMMRNRVTVSGENWLNDKAASFYGGKLQSSHMIFTEKQQRKIDHMNRWLKLRTISYIIFRKIFNKVSRGI